MVYIQSAARVMRVTLALFDHVHIKMVCAAVAVTDPVLAQIGFKSIGTLKTDMLHQLRIAQQAALSVEVAAHKKRLEDILCTNAAARASKTAGKSDNPLATALGQCKGQSLPVPIHGYATSKLTTILESPIEMWGEDY